MRSKFYLTLLIYYTSIDNNSQYLYKNIHGIFIHINKMPLFHLRCLYEFNILGLIQEKSTKQGGKFIQMNDLADDFVLPHIIYIDMHI